MADEENVVSTIQVEITAPERMPVQLEAKEVTVPGGEGVFTVLPGHTPMLSTLGVGVLIAWEANGEARFFAINGGFVEVLNNRVVILATTVEGEEELDEERARAAVTQVRYNVPFYNIPWSWRKGIYN
ncbi:MAG: ATP synthase F1 subunit epsilon, partial [Candidatus Hydrogenedentota bacterium]